MGYEESLLYLFTHEESRDYQIVTKQLQCYTHSTLSSLSRSQVTLVIICYRTCSFFSKEEVLEAGIAERTKRRESSQTTREITEIADKRIYAVRFSLIKAT